MQTAPDAVPSAASPAESIATSAVMASAGGFIDAFTFVGHGHVFANAMSGNAAWIVAAWLAIGSVSLVLPAARDARSARVAERR